MTSRRIFQFLTGLVCAALLLPCTSCISWPVDVAPESGYEQVARDLEAIIEREMESKRLPALSIVLVDDQEIVWARGFGMADAEQDRPATAGTMYRVGSVSKLFTDIAVMQLVEKGELDLDAPVTRYLPHFRPERGKEHEITLRHLTSHRSGIVREPPVGHYFDDTGPSLAATVASLNGTGFIYPTGTRIKYSNAGIAVVGYVLEKSQGEPFTSYVKRAVLDPMGMPDCAFEPNPWIERRLAKAVMWTYDGREFEAPDFQLGMAPAGSLYASVKDLGQFMKVMFREGEGPDGRVLEPETLAQMVTPQFSDAEWGGYGIGFRLGRLDGRKLCGHGGAIYGFATDLQFLPDEKLGVAVVTSVDCANSVVSRIGHHALRLMVAAREGTPPPVLLHPETPEVEFARSVEGRYRSGDRTLELRESFGRLLAFDGSTQLSFGVHDGALMMDDRLATGGRIEVVDRDTLKAGRAVFEREPASRPSPAPASWSGLIGEYGWDHNVLYVLERDGHLYALIEWFEFDRLKELSPDVFAFPARSGMYHGETLAFKRDERGAATEARIGGLVFKRRAVGPVDGKTFKIAPLATEDELRRRALAAQPPEESRPRAPDLVDLADLDPDMKFDIRYAGTNNFMGTVFYKQPRAFMQRPAAEALVRAHRAMRKKGYGFLIHDAYRPWYVTKMFWDATPQSMKDFVADPSKGSRHNRGCAVDLTLYDLKTGKPVEMVGVYDEFSERSYPEYPGGKSLQRWHRDLLRRTMEEHGFSVYKYEWWHFDYEDWRAYPIQNLTFEQIDVQHPGR